MEVRSSIGKLPRQCGGDDVRRREFAPLKAIADHCPKTILSLDVDLVGYENGIRTMNALDFLLDR